MSSNLYGSFYKSEQLPQPLRVVILHHRTCKFAPAETVSIYRDQIPALLPFCRKRLPGQIRACFIHRQIPAVTCFLRRNCKRQCVCRFQPVLFNCAKMQARTQHMQPSGCRHMFRHQIQLLSKKKQPPGIICRYLSKKLL